MDFFTGENVIMDYGLFGFGVKHLDEFCLLQTQFFILQDDI